MGTILDEIDAGVFKEVAPIIRAYLNEDGASEEAANKVLDQLSEFFVYGVISEDSGFVVLDAIGLYAHRNEDMEKLYHLLEQMMNNQSADGVWQVFDLWEDEWEDEEEELEAWERPADWWKNG